jgi:hypothetical protein
VPPFNTALTAGLLFVASRPTEAISVKAELASRSVRSIAQGDRKA